MLTSFPADTIAHILSFVTDTPTLLIARSVSRALRNGVPVNRLIGIDKATAEWLLTNIAPERWLKASMRHTDFTVCVHDNSITTYVRDDSTRTRTESHQPLSTRYAFPNIEDHRCVVTTDLIHDTCTLSIMHNLDEDEDELIVTDSGDGVCAFCELPGVLYMATANGTVYSLDLDQPVRDIANEFRNKRAQTTARAFNLADAIAHTPYQITKMATTDGKAFTFLVNDELMVHCDQDKPPVIVYHDADEEIKDFWLLERDVAVCWFTNNRLLLLSFPMQRFTAVVSPRWPVTNTTAIHITPVLKSIWILDDRQRLYRVGAPTPVAPVAMKPEKSADFYRCKSNRLMRKLREANARNLVLTIKLEAMQARFNDIADMQV